MAWLAGYVFYLVLPTALGAGIMAGLLFAFSNFLMRALSKLSPASGMEAMQRINLEILNPVFLCVFLGTGVLCLLTIAASFQVSSSAGRPYFLAGAICYLAGVLGVTMVFNVPLNNALASLGSSAASEQWPRYVTSWLRWNHVRTILAVLAAALFIIGVRVNSAAAQ